MKVFFLVKFLAFVRGSIGTVFPAATDHKPTLWLEPVTHQFPLHWPFTGHPPAMSPVPAFHRYSIGHQMDAMTGSHCSKLPNHWLLRYRKLKNRLWSSLLLVSNISEHVTKHEEHLKVSQVMRSRVKANELQLPMMQLKWLIDLLKTRTLPEGTEAQIIRYLNYILYLY